MSKSGYTTRVVQYKEDPAQSDALAEIKRLSNQAKNKSSTNLIYIKDKLDINTETNTEINKNMFKENGDINTFQRRKRQFATQISKPSIANEIKKKANLKKWKGLFDNDKEDNSNKKKNKNNKHVDFTINYKERKGVTDKNESKKNYYTTKTFNVDNKVKDEENINPINRKRKTSSDERETISQRIVLYLDNPKDSSALAEIKRISNQAKKNKTSKNLIHINPDLIVNSPKEKETKDEEKPVQTFKRRKFQFATTVYTPKKNNLTLLDELHKYKNVKVNNKEEKEFKEAGSEDDESEDSIFNLDKNEKEQKEENKENNKIDNFSKYEEPKKEKEVKETKEERIPIQVNRNFNNKGRTPLMERYKKIAPRNERLKYSSNTVNVSEINKYSTSRNNDYMPRASLNYSTSTITEEYKKDNNLTVENRNTKELIVKNEYSNKTKGKKGLKTYKTEYFWDKMINRLVEKRIYFDENEPSNNNNNTKYSNNSFNPFSKYKKDFETKENENNVTKEKIELDKDDKRKDNNVQDNKTPYSRKYKYLPHLYATNTFRTVKNVNNKESLNQNNETSSKPSYRVYQKRQIISTKEELKENNPQKNKTEINDKEENVKYMKRLQKKEPEERKNIYSRITPNPQVQSEKYKKNDEVKFKKITQPYSSNINNTKRKIIRLNVHPEENEGSFTDRNNNKNNNIYYNYMKSQRTKILTHNKTNSELIEDLERIEQYSVNTYLRNDLLEIYGTIDEEFKDFKKGVFNTNLNRFEKKMGEFDNKDEFIKKKKKFDVNNLCKGKTTTDDIYKKYKKRAIKIERGTYNN